MYADWQAEYADSGEAVRGNDIVRTDFKFWLRNKIVIKNCTTQSKHFTVHSVPKLIIKKVDAELGANAAGGNVKCAVEKDLGPHRLPQEQTIHPGKTASFYLGAESEYGQVTVENSRNSRQVPRSRQLNYQE